MWSRSRGELIIFKKHDYVRSKKLLALVAQLPCQHCGIDGQTQAAHTNWGGGKGRGIKADDNLTAALCQPCHAEIDSGAKSPRTTGYVVCGTSEDYSKHSHQW